ncbi:uncharacterized protein YjbI with pentapeptide repeats [Shinella sp. BE166]
MSALQRGMFLGFAAAFLGMAVGLSSGDAKAADCRSDPAPEIDWSDCAKKSLMLSGNDFTGANFRDADLSSTDMRNTTLTGADLEKATLVRTWFTDARLDKANFARVEAYRSIFKNVFAQGASFASAELQRAAFNGADLTNTSFEKADVSRADFDEAILSGASFAYANLARADLSEAKVERALGFNRAFMLLTRIEGLDLSGATGLDQSQIDIACGDAETKLPNGLTTPTSWPCAQE